MTLDLTCTECESSFELDVQDLADNPKRLVCANCNSKAPPRKVEALAAALEDLVGAMQDLSSKFEISLAAETDELTAESDRPSKGRKEDEDDDTEEDADVDDEDGELEFGE